MAKSVIQQIEEAMVAALRAAMPGVDVESYAGQLDDELAEWMRRLPCVWVTFERISQVQVIGRRKLRNTARFQVLAAQRALGNENAARLGGHGQAGVYELLDTTVKRVLMHSRIGLPIQPLVPTSVAMVAQGFFGNEAAAVMSIGWQTSYDETIDEPGADQVADLTKVGLNYPLKPGDNVPDGADLVTLNP